MWLCCCRLCSMCQIWRKRDFCQKRLQASCWRCCRKPSNSEPELHWQLIWYDSRNKSWRTGHICLPQCKVYTCHIYKSIKSFVDLVQAEFVQIICVAKHFSYSKVLVGWFYFDEIQKCNFACSQIVTALVPNRYMPPPDPRPKFKICYRPDMCYNTVLSFKSWFWDLVSIGTNVQEKARFAFQVPKLTNVILNCVLIHWYVWNLNTVVCGAFLIWQ